MHKRYIYASLAVILLFASACGIFESEHHTKAENLQPTQAPMYSYRIINRYPHDPEAFTQGLFYHNGVLYEGTGGWGHSSIRRVDLETGKVLQISNLDKRYFGEGIVLWQDRIIQLTWKSNTGFVYDRDTFEKINEFKYPTEGWGITQDGKRLIMSDGTNILYFWDPDSFQDIEKLQVRDGDTPVPRLNELEYVKGEIWANVWGTDLIARISPQTGQVLSWIDLTGLLDIALRRDPNAVLNGIAYDEKGDRIFVTGKLWPTLFEIQLIPKP
ncbi:MAG: glutaminyl-peptide cyclotransferase [Hormoscilla sp. SP5CHS1]|nr:glutaminyl-peptide cyclotransferase [Hormoscilla sp. SP12CHS1]MBC6455847.1 glutaminyl-peptide cyclotransferase [Hormoscilla sp. SP5CHS1]